MNEANTTDQPTTLCIQCRSIFTDKQTEGANCCPNCGTKSIPADINYRVKIDITVHELRLLTIWAMNWAVSNKDKDQEGYDSVASLSGVIQEIHNQNPDLDMPLTMEEEFRDVKKNYPNMKVTDEKGNEIPVADNSKLN